MMRGVVALLVAAPLVCSALPATSIQLPARGDEYLSWSAERAQSIGEPACKRGRVGGMFDGRLLKTERAYNYKLAATLLAPQTIRATARVLQLRSRLPPAQTIALVEEAERVAGLVVMVEIDPREGSGVIPLDWEAFLQPKNRPDAAIRGVNRPELRDVKALAGVLRRNYDYDRFWIVFPADAAASLVANAQDLQLVVRIDENEGHVEWPASLLRGIAP